MKKLLSLLVALSMLFSLGTTAFADSGGNSYKNIRDQIVEPMIVDPGDGRDITYSPNGGSWISDPGQPDPDPDGYNYHVAKKVFLPHDEADAYYELLDNPTVAREAYAKFMTYGTNATVAFLVDKLGITHWAASWLIGSIFAEISDIDDIFTYDKDELLAANSGSEGVIITTVYIPFGPDGLPLLINFYDSWSGTYIWGEAGYTGSFDLNDFTPLVRYSF